MFQSKYLSREHLEGFDNYKYQAVDTSPLSVYVMHPFWNNVVKLFPTWVAPNLLTFAGFLLTVADFVLLSVYDYSYTASVAHNSTSGDTVVDHRVPDCLWFVCAAFLFVAYTLDGIDGKQARRTQTSGPLGELFDHGLDSYSVFFIPACLYSTLGRGDFSVPPVRMYYVMWSLLLNFYLSHWEKYNTGVLFLPWGYDFGMWASILFFVATGIVGTDSYKIYVYADYTVANVFEVLVYATGLSNLPVAIYNTYKSYRTGAGKMRTPLEALRPLWSLLFVFLLCSVWVHKSPNSIVDYDPRMVFLLIGTLFSNVACRLIVSQMSNQRCEVVNWLSFPLSIGLLISLYIPFLEIIVFYAITVGVVLAHIDYGTCVVREMCEHFRIGCFYIKKRSD